ncbi:MAG TPA: hypothetical protein DIT25_04545 [Candidatus Moranbacteria bacterium]|nr:hypothetical protein [Candidatus Moranbacteria bacterium]
MYPKIFRKIFHHVIPPEDRARHMVEDAVNSAFKLFRDKEFRKEIGFEKMEQIEQDRIFNELEVTFVGFLYLLIENRLKYFPEERRNYWHSVKGSVFPRFINWFKELGIEQEHIETWEKLVDLRLDEYRGGLEKTRIIWENSLEQDKTSTESMKNEAIILSALTIAGVLHIRRGESTQADPLNKTLGIYMSLLVQNWNKEIR